MMDTDRRLLVQAIVIYRVRPFCWSIHYRIETEIDYTRVFFSRYFSRYVHIVLLDT